MGKLTNRLRIHTSYLCRKAKVAGGPVEIGVEVTNACNFKCSMCARYVMKRPIGFMSWETFSNCIRAVKPFAELVWVHGLGEPLLHSKLVDMVAFTAENGIPPGIATNAMLLTRELSHELLKAGLAYIIFPMDGATAETYEKIRIGSNFEKIVHNIKTFLETKRKLGYKTSVIIQMVSRDTNRHEAEDVIKIWSKQPGITAVRIKRAIDFSLTKELRIPTTPLRCYYIWRQHNFYWDGKMSICCNDNDGMIPIGNINEKPHDELWNGERFQSVRKLHAKNRGSSMELCRKCDTAQPNNLTVVGCSLLNNMSIRTLLPVVETCFDRLFFKSHE